MSETNNATGNHFKRDAVAPKSESAIHSITPIEGSVSASGENKDDSPSFCPKCGTALVEGMSFCPKCGSKARATGDDAVAEANVFSFDKVMEHIKSLKKTQLIAIACVMVIILAVVATNLIPTGPERQAEEAARTLKSMMKNPDSFTIRGDILVVEHAYEDGSIESLIAIDHSGENSYGGTARGTAIFSDGEYLGDYDDEVDVTGYSSEEEIDDALAFASAKYLLVSATSDESTYVDGKKIADRVGASHSD